MPPWCTSWYGLPGGRGPYCGTLRPLGLREPFSSCWTPPHRPLGTRWPPACRGTASGWRLGPRRRGLRGLWRAKAPVGPRTAESLLARPRTTMGAATLPPLQGTTWRGRHRVGCRPRRGGRAPGTGGRPGSSLGATCVTTSSMGTSATTACTRRVRSRYPGSSGAPGRSVMRSPAPGGLVPSGVGSFVGGVCEGYPVLGVVCCIIRFFSS